MIDLAKKLNIDNDLIIALSKLDKTRIDKLTNDCLNSFSILVKENDLVRLAVCLSYAEKNTKPAYIEKGIPLDVYYDTLSDIKIWCCNNDNKGLKNYNWIKNHLKLELFKLGRLQFQLYNCKNKTLNYDLMPFSYGDNLVYIHIPQGEKLEYSLCVESIKQSMAFLNEYFNDYKFNFYFCESWLLYDRNYEFMSPSSNILQFQSLFDIIYCEPDDNQAIERIFGKRQLFKSKYQENTSLQKSAKQFMKSGNKLGVGTGIIFKYDI